MKALKAENNFGHTVQEISLADIMLNETDNVYEYKSAIFRRQFVIGCSIASNGLKNPIIVLADGEKFRFVCSGARITYAILNGYTHIDAIVLNDESEVRPLQIEQAKTEINYIAEEYIYNWWEEETANLDEALETPAE
jgi:hypothetical protein